MSSSEQADTDAVESDVTVELGDELRRAREQKKLSHDDIAKRLNLAVSVVESLERDDYEGLPEMAYVRGYLLAYIRILGLPESLLESFDARYLAETPLLPTYRSSNNTSSGKMGGPVLIVVVLAIAGAAYWFGGSHINETPSDANPEPVVDVAETESEAVESVSITSVRADNIESEESGAAVVPVQPDLVEDPTILDSIDVTSVENSDTSNLPQQAATIEQSTVISEPDTVAQQNESSPAKFSMKFIGSSWIQISGADGSTLRSGTFNEGELIELNDAGPYKLVLGRARNIELMFDGESVDLKPYYNKVARITLGQ